MPTVFDSISDGFYTAFFEPDPEKRKEAIEAWIKESTPVIQSAVENDLRSYLEEILEATWTEKGWEARAKKFFGTTSSLVRKSDPPSFIDAYKLYLDIKLRRHESRDKDVIIGTLTPEVRKKTNDAIEATKRATSKIEPPSPEDDQSNSMNSNDDEDGYDDCDDGARSPNDDRSESMNPNNDSYQASMDNRSDQMNPNNSAYWSSRGR